MKSNKIALALMLFILPLLTNAQCAMCRAVLESSGNSAQAEGINKGIMYLVMWPYLCIAGVGIMVWWTMKKQKERKKTELDA